MTPERWRAIDAAFAAARDLPTAERGELLTRLGAGDDSLRREVEALLAAEGELAGEPAFLAAPIAPSPPEARTLAEPVAGYRLLGVLGQGGGGIVYRALDQQGRAVALKVGWSTISRVESRRFLREQEILARLAHPGITTLYEAGSTAAGRPYLSMELLDGQRLDRHCDDRRQGAGERLALFGQLCAAVGHVHAAGIVHRDLKPGNVLATRDGRVKLLDFGIAKALDSSTFATRLDPTASQGVQLLTPGYASPEQIRGEKVGPASDVFSLGVLLFELLIGVKPYRFEGSSPPLLDLLQAVCDRPLLSLGEALERAAGEPGGGRELCRRRGAASLEELRGQLPRGVEKALERALASSPARRPQDATAFGAEIGAGIGAGDAGGRWAKFWRRAG